MGKLLNIKFNFFGDKEIKETKEKGFLPFSILEEQEEWLDFCYNKKDPNNIRMLLTSREYGKTKVIANEGILRILSKNPKTTFCIISRTVVKARKILKPIHSFLDQTSLEIVKLDETEIRTKENLEDITPSIYCMGLSSSVKMFHFDYCIMDDVLDPEDERSKIWKGRSKDFYDNTGGF